ncbi:MAG: YkgJ family cysteine cluster protein [Bryobacteraceae bacterium]|nr:YkgJ family cysteine cluster protein [Bryobacteraceae bacterium]
MVTDPDQVRRLAESKEAENLHFRRHLHAHHVPVEPFQILAHEIERQIDCTQCANCCRRMIVELTPSEIEVIAAHLCVPVQEVMRKHIDPEPGDSYHKILRTGHGGCTFLDGSRCSIYEARPAACRDFPHVSPGQHTLGARMESVCRHSSVCPILYNALEAYKAHVGYHPHS